MNLSYITFSGANNTTPQDQLVNILNYFPKSEVAVQASPNKMAPGTDNNKWFNDFLHIARNLPNPVNIAVHVNRGWCDLLCRGIMPPALIDWFYLTRTDGTPVIRRWQINMAGSNTEKFDIHRLAGVIENHKDREFIMQYNANPILTRKINSLAYNCKWGDFSVLHDGSFGLGIEIKNILPPYQISGRKSPLTTGYAGGVSPTNVYDVLSKIEPVVGNEKTWIDAESRLKDKSGNMDLNLVKQYLLSANAWDESR